MTVSRFRVDFTAFILAAVSCAGALVALISFACQTARISAGDHGSEVRVMHSPRPQDGLSHPVKTDRHTGGKPVSLPPAKGGALAGSPGSADYVPVSIRRPRGSDPALPPRCECCSRKLQVAGSVERSQQGVRSVPARKIGPAFRSLAGPWEAEPGSLPHLRALATNAAGLCGVPVALFHALIERESSWRPDVVSSAGAVGLAQVKPSTARGVSPGLDVRDPWQNLLAGACYLRQQYDRFGTWRKALHAYRLGPNALVTRTAREYATDIITGSAQ